MRRARASAFVALACAGACFFGSTVVRAEPSKLPPEVGYNYAIETETARVASKNGADRALGELGERAVRQPSEHGDVARVYHAAGAVADLARVHRRQSYGVGAVDSIGSSSRVAGVGSARRGRGKIRTA